MIIYTDVNTGRLVVWSGNPLDMPSLKDINRLNLVCELPLLWSITAVTAQHKGVDLKRLNIYVLSRKAAKLTVPSIEKRKKVK